MKRTNLIDIIALFNAKVLMCSLKTYRKGCKIMHVLLESRINCGIIREMVGLPVGAQKEREEFEKTFLGGEASSYYCIWRKTEAKKVQPEKAVNFQEVIFERKIGPTQCFEHIELGILCDGNLVYTDSKHNDNSGYDFQMTSFAEASVGQRINKELQRVYKKIIMCKSKINKTIGTPDYLDLGFVYINKVFIDDKKQPVIVTSIEVLSKFYIDHS